MKTFNLTHYSERNGSYHVFLTWGKSFEFTQVKTAKRFLAQTNRFLTECLVDVTNSLIEVESCYWKNWLLFYHNKASHDFSFYQDDRRCIAALEAVKSLLNSAFDRHGFDSGSVIAFENFRKCIDHLTEVCEVFRKYYHRRSETFNTWNINLLSQKMNERKRALETWGVDSANRADMKIHFSYQQVIPLFLTQNLQS